MNGSFWNKYIRITPKSAPNLPETTHNYPDTAQNWPESKSVQCYVVGTQSGGSTPSGSAGVRFANRPPAPMALPSLTLTGGTPSHVGLCLCVFSCVYVLVCVRVCGGGCPDLVWIVSFGNSRVWRVISPAHLMLLKKQQICPGWRSNSSEFIQFSKNCRVQSSPNLLIRGSVSTMTCFRHFLHGENKLSWIAASFSTRSVQIRWQQKMAPPTRPNETKHNLRKSWRKQPRISRRRKTKNILLPPKDLPESELFNSIFARHQGVRQAFGIIRNANPASGGNK